MTQIQSVTIPEQGTEQLRELVGDEVPLDVASDFGCVAGGRVENMFHLNSLCQVFLSVAHADASKNFRSRLRRPRNHWGARAELEFLTAFHDREFSVQLPNGERQPDLVCTDGPFQFSVEVTNLIEPREIMGSFMSEISLPMRLHAGLPKVDRFTVDPLVNGP